jgi:hypothetical protein
MNDSILQRALVNLLGELFDGPPANAAFVLNPGDPGLLCQLDGISAAAASSRPMPGQTTIAAHVDHLHYGLTLLNRWAAGEENPFATADWEASWKRGSVTPEQWQTLRDNLRDAAATWKTHVSERTSWDDLAASGSLGSAAHTAYHLGAIRQILAAQGK